MPPSNGSSRNDDMRRFLESLFLTFFIFGFAGWLYIVGNSFAHPETLSMPLTHFLPYPREDTSGEISFVVSFVSFFLWRLVRK